MIQYDDAVLLKYCGSSNCDKNMLNPSLRQSGLKIDIYDFRKMDAILSVFMEH